MAGIQKKVPILILLLLTSSATALELDISLDAESKADVSDTKFSSNFTDVFEANASVYNSGSFECRYRLRADINETNSNETYEAYSRSASLWPGEFERLNVYYSPKNYTGEIEGNLYIEFCGREELVKEFNASSTEPTTANNTLSLKEKEVNQSSARFNLNKSKTLLIPREKPDFWKVGYAEVENSTGILDYEMPFENFERNITYLAVNKTSKEPLGLVESDLQVDETLRSKLIQNKYLVGMAASMLLNLLLILYLLKSSGFEAKVLNSGSSNSST